MGRRVITPDAGPRACHTHAVTPTDPATRRSELAQRLDEARRRQHLSIRAAARLADVPTATAQGWLSGKHTPTPALRTHFAKLVAALGLSDELDLDWADLDATLADARADAPYVGLRPFAQADAPRFFGRGAETRRIAEAVLALAPGHGLVAVVGPSGSGKSSLLAAGLLGRESGPDGLLAGTTGAVTTVADLSSAPVVDLLVVDQFEDVLTDPQRLRPVVEEVVRRAAASRVVLGVRADAYPRLLEVPELHDALSHPILPSPMTDADLREAVEGPARAVGLEVEPGLVDLVVRDLTPPGTSGPLPLTLLPLLSNALMVTWGVGRGRRMTIADYKATGGLGSAVETLAEGVHHTLDAAQQDSARLLFLRLVTTAAGLVVRERVPLASLDATEAAVVDAFVRARILTVGAADVRISHDALLTHWPRLAAWIEDGQDDLRLRQHLDQATLLWLASDRSTDSLLPVDRLPIFDPLVESPDLERALTPDQREFLAASRRHFTSQLDLERRRSTALRSRGLVAAGLAAVAAILAVVAVVGFVDARTVQRAAQSRQVASEARTIRARDTNLEAQMALVSDAIAPTREGLSALLGASSLDVPTRWTGEGQGSVAVSPDASLVARAAGLGRVTLWRGDALASDPGTTFTVDPAGGQLFSVALGRAGARWVLAAGGAGGFRALWDVTAEPVRLADLPGAGEATTYAAALDAAGATLALGRSDGAVELWSLADPARPTLRSTLRITGAVSSFAFDPLRPRLYVGGAQDLVAVWDLATPEPTRLPDLPFSPGAKVRAQALAASPDGRWLVAGLGAPRLARWDLTPDAPAFTGLVEGFDNWFNAVAFSADSTRLAAGNSDQRLYVLDAATLTTERTLVAPALVTGAAFVGDAPVGVGGNGSLWAWAPTSRTLKPANGRPPYQLSTDAAGRWLVGSPAPDGSLRVWDVAAGSRRVDSVPAPVPLMTGAIVTPDGRWGYSGTRNGEVVRWRMTDAGGVDPVVQRVLPEKTLVVSVAVDPSGRLLAAASYTGTTTALLALSGDGAPTPLATLETPKPQALSFSADGTLLQVGVDDGVRIFDVRDPARAVLRSTVPLGTVAAASTFAPRSSLLAAATEAGEVTVWDVSDAAAPRRTARFSNTNGAMYALAFSPDEQLLVAGSNDELVWGWDLTRSGTDAAFALDAQVGRLAEIRFLPGGRTLVAAGSTGEVRLWELDADATRASLCARRGTPLSDAEWTSYLPGIARFDPCGR